MTRPRRDRAGDRLRLAISVGGLALVGVAVAIRPIDLMAAVEVIGIAALFFAVSAARAAARLFGKEDA